MRYNNVINLAVLASLSAAALAQTDDRMQATQTYHELLAERYGGVQPAPVDPGLAVAGFSGYPFLDDLTPGYVVIEGDIQIPLEEYDGTRTGAVFGTVDYWGTVMPFDFDSNVNAERRQQAIDAMNAIRARAGINFRPRTADDQNWVRFQASNFNNSAVGRRGGMQIINIVSWDSQIIIIHELYHALGFWHQQSAPDRNAFVTINYANICGSSGAPGDPCHANNCQSCADDEGNFTSCAHNFNIAGGAGTWGPYDFDSFMHYSRTTFSCNGMDTITVNEPWNAEWQAAIGQRTHFSLIDELTCRGIYPFAGDRWLRSGTGGSQQGTFFNPFRGSFPSAIHATPQNGTLLIDPGNYGGSGTFNQAKTLRATYGLVRLGT